MSKTIFMIADVVLIVGNVILAIVALWLAFSGADAPSALLLWAITAAVCLGLSNNGMKRIEERLAA